MELIKLGERDDGALEVLFHWEDERLETFTIKAIYLDDQPLNRSDWGDKRLEGSNEIDLFQGSIEHTITLNDVPWEEGTTKPETFKDFSSLTFVVVGIARVSEHKSAPFEREVRLELGEQRQSPLAACVIATVLLTTIFWVRYQEMAELRPDDNWAGVFDVGKIAFSGLTLASITLWLNRVRFITGPDNASSPEHFFSNIRARLGDKISDRVLVAIFGLAAMLMAVLNIAGTHEVWINPTKEHVLLGDYIIPPTDQVKGVKAWVWRGFYPEATNGKSLEVTGDRARLVCQDTHTLKFEGPATPSHSIVWFTGEEKNEERYVHTLDSTEYAAKTSRSVCERALFDEASQVFLRSHTKSSSLILKLPHRPGGDNTNSTELKHIDVFDELLTKLEHAGFKEHSVRIIARGYRSLEAAKKQGGMRFDSIAHNLDEARASEGLVFQSQARCQPGATSCGLIWPATLEPGDIHLDVLIDVEDSGTDDILGSSSLSLGNNKGMGWSEDALVKQIGALDVVKVTFGEALCRFWPTVSLLGHQRQDPNLVSANEHTYSALAGRWETHATTCQSVFLLNGRETPEYQYEAVVYTPGDKERGVAWQVSEELSLDLDNHRLVVGKDEVLRVGNLWAPQTYELGCYDKRLSLPKRTPTTKLALTYRLSSFATTRSTLPLAWANTSLTNIKAPPFLSDASAMFFNVALDFEQKRLDRYVIDSQQSILMIDCLEATRSVTPPPAPPNGP